MRTPGKGCLLSLKADEEKDPKPHCCSSCIVKHPCACCWLSLFLAIGASVMGILVVSRAVPEDAEAGPLRGPEDGLTYPFRNDVAKKMDALALAVDDSEAALLRYDTTRRSRRLSSQRNALALGGSEGGGRREAPKDMTEMVLNYLAGRPNRSARNRRGRRAQEGSHTAGTQFQQEHELAAAYTIYRAKDDGASWFDDAALGEICEMHRAITQARNYDSYCRKQLSWEMGDGTRVTYCSTGMTPLAFFYGNEEYDVENVDLTTFDIADLNGLYQARGPAGWNGLYDSGDTESRAAAVAAYGEADVARAETLYNQIFGYMTGAWTNGTLIHSQTEACTAAQAKDRTAVITLVAGIRDTGYLNNVYGGLINFYFDKHFNGTNLVSEYSRGHFEFGGPLAGFSNVIDSSLESRQQSRFGDWWFDEGLQDIVSDSHSNWREIQPTCLVSTLLTRIITRLLIIDASLAVVPLVVVFLVVWLQTRSIFIAIITLTEMLLSFTSAIFVTAGVLQIKWLAFEQFLALYIVLAIGADDAFVFMDAYKQSFYAGPKVNQSLELRMAWVYRRAGLAMLITSLTTAAAFVATALSSPIPTLQNFGIFAAAVILIDYTLVMTLLCSCVVIYHNWFEMRAGLCCACCSGCAAEEGDKCDVLLCYPKRGGGCAKLCCNPEYVGSTAIAREGGKATEQQSKNALVVLFEDVFPFNLVVKPVIPRVVSMLAFIIILPFAIYGVAQLEPQKSAENFLPESHPFQRFFTASNAFLSSNEDRTSEIQIVWGFESDDPIDLAGVNRLIDPDNKGSPNYEAAFKLDEAAQLSILDTCALLRISDATKKEFDESTGEQVDTVYWQPPFMEVFRAAREANLGNGSFPVPEAEIDQALLDWLDGTLSFYDPVAEEWFGEPWEFEGDLGWAYREGATVPTLTFASVRASSKIRERAYLPAPELRVYYDEWEAVLVEINAGSPASLGTAMQVCEGASDQDGNKWIHMVLQETYVKMALTGVVIGLSIALVVLLLATWNVIMAILCIGTIAAALCCVVGSVVLMGWELGSAESLSMMILTGFAVDYVVHLSHAYMESTSETRLERTHDALRDLGISVFWGMLTSVISSGVLATLQLQFFSKFGTFFLLTIIWAYAWAVLFLMPLLAVVGPEVKGAKDRGEKGLEGRNV